MKEGAHDFGARVAPGGVVADVERDPGTESDDGQCFPGRWNGTGNHRRRGPSDARPAATCNSEKCKRSKHATSRRRGGAERDARRKAFAPYQVNDDLMSLARPGALFMHCLPAHRGEEVTADVFESEVSVVFDQAENRLHGQKALLRMLLAPAKSL